MLSIFFFLPAIFRLDIISPTVILGEGLSAPGFHLRPRLSLASPEIMVGWQSERHQRETGHIERTIIRVPVGRLWLVSAETDSKEATLIVILLLVIHPMHHLRQGGTHLSVT